MSTLQQRFLEAYPKVLYFEHENSAGLSNYLHSRGVMSGTERVVRVEKPGSGNMNFVMRVNTDQKSFILKQARPWVEKYPHVGAPVNRVEMEAAFYTLIRKYPAVNQYSAQLLDVDADNFVLILEDLGNSADFSYLYEGLLPLELSEAEQLLRFLSHLHEVQESDFPDNMAMRSLNHEHIFRYPFLVENGFDLDVVLPGLQALSMKFKKNEGLKTKISELGNLYLSDAGHSLIHGDFFPGSWLKTADGVKVIDQEFAFIGKPEFDLGVFGAHLLLSGHSINFIEEALNYYQKPSNFDESLVWNFAGVEVMRRIIGLAQLPLSLNLKQREQVLELATKLI
jgi:5-methylthioribose kinase